MMRIPREKLAATWNVVKGSTPTQKVPYSTLEMYRPLFKYITGREMARLNLSDNKILSFIGTHPELNRHQVKLNISHDSSSFPVFLIIIMLSRELAIAGDPPFPCHSSMLCSATMRFFCQVGPEVKMA